MTYRMIMIGGKARMSRPSSVLYPLPSVRVDRKVNAGYVHVRDVAPTAIVRAPSREWAPGMILPRTMGKLVFP